jgi:protein ImuB
MAAPTRGEPPMRPLFLFDPPRRVEVLAEVPDGPPHRFRWRRKLHEVRLYEGQSGSPTSGGGTRAANVPARAG